MNRLQLEQLKTWHERQLDQIKHVLPGCQSCRFTAPSCMCEIYGENPPRDVFLLQGCDQWEHEVGRASVMWRADGEHQIGRDLLRPALKVAVFDDMDDDIPFK